MPYRSHAWGTGECAIHRMRTLSRRLPVQTWCARKRILTSLELGKDGKIQIHKHPSSSAYGSRPYKLKLLPDSKKPHQHQYLYYKIELLSFFFEQIAVLILFVLFVKYDSSADALSSTG